MLAIVTSHPIQYQAPLWRALAQDGRIPFEVWFLTPHAVAPSHDREFGTTFAWDVNLLEGYRHRFLEVEPSWALNRFNGVKVRQSWRRLLRDSGVTTLWVEGWRFRTLWSAVAAAHALGIPVWLRGENDDLTPEPTVKWLWKHLALKWYFNRVSQFLCIGTANRRFYHRHGVTPARMVSTPYCVDNARFASAATILRPKRDELRRAWQIEPSERCLLFCGKFIPKKRPFDLLTAARDLGNVDGHPLHLLWVGDGELGPALRKSSADASSRSTFTGFLNQSEIVAAFVVADCLVLPSDYGETWGLVVNEAMASGTPAVASDRCGCAEDLVAPQSARQMFHCGEITALTAAIATALHSPPSAERLQWLIETHAPTRTVESVVSLISSTDESR